MNAADIIVLIIGLLLGCFIAFLFWLHIFRPNGLGK